MATTTKPPRRFIEITPPRPSGARFFELRAPKTIIPSGLIVDSASARGVKLVSLCVDGVEQITRSLDAEMFGDVSVTPELELPTMLEGQMLDMTFTGDIKKLKVLYREPVVGAAPQVLRPGVVKRSK